MLQIPAWQLLLLNKIIISEEKKRRIRVLLWAYAYEVKSVSLVSDEVFDRECEKIDLSVCTGHPVMDRWFKKTFDPCTGMWIRNLERKHPREWAKLERLYELLHGHLLYSQAIGIYELS